MTGRESVRETTVSVLDDGSGFTPNPGFRGFWCEVAGVEDPAAGEGPPMFHIFARTREEAIGRLLAIGQAIVYAVEADLVNDGLASIDGNRAVLATAPDSGEITAPPYPLFPDSTPTGTDDPAGDWPLHSASEEFAAACAGGPDNEREDESCPMPR